LACDLNTASVFHSMRVIEHGLRALAAKLRVRIAKGKPINEATWGAIISELSKKIASLSGLRNQTAKQKETLICYRMALSDCSKFKDLYRNDVMHTKGSYNETEALGVYKRVEEFMQSLINLEVRKSGLRSLLRGIN
jgi:hypothetical protein